MRIYLVYRNTNLVKRLKERVIIGLLVIRLLTLSLSN